MTAYQEEEQGELTQDNLYKAKSSEEVREIALGMYRGEIFTSMQIREHDKHLLPNIFMPLIFMDETHHKMMKEADVTELYADMDSSTGVGINGYPIFTGCGFLSREDTEKVIQKYNEILEVMKNV